MLHLSICKLYSDVLCYFGVYVLYFKEKCGFWWNFAKILQMPRFCCKLILKNY